jgi:hypothetical protein
LTSFLKVLRCVVCSVDAILNEVQAMKSNWKKWQVNTIAV